MSEKPVLSTGWHEEEPRSATPGQFGRYSVVRELGKGGMANVYEGRHPQLGSRVALKVMNPAIAAHPLAATRFLREAKAASQIRHDNVVEVFDIGTEGGVPFIVMEFVEGSDLAALLAERGALPLAGLVDVFLPVLSAIATAHQSGIIHRDLKPANVMLARRGPRGMHPMVLDFGISKLVNDDSENPVTRSESLVGTVQYMAPELTKSARTASVSSDQYALGVMLYECATGKRPFSGDSHYALLHAIVTGPVVAPSRINPSLPPEFDALVLRAMARDPAKRFPSVRALGSALLSFGGRSAWALWEGEFAGKAGDDREPWTGSSRTLADDADRQAGPFPVARRARRRWSFWLTAAVALYAAAATALLVRRPAPATTSLAADPPPAPAAAVNLATPSGEPAGDDPMKTAIAARGVPPASDLIAPTAKPAAAASSAAPLSVAVPNRKPARGSPGSKPATSTAAQTGVEANRPPKGSPVLGTNGAPIVE